MSVHEYMFEMIVISMTAKVDRVIELRNDIACHLIDYFDATDRESEGRLINEMIEDLKKVAEQVCDYYDYQDTTEDMEVITDALNLIRKVPSIMAYYANSPPPEH